ncbi:hypothetical protein Plhal304r1_c002g0008801 [Plasmopara halstedii]
MGFLPLYYMLVLVLFTRRLIIQAPGKYAIPCSSSSIDGGRQSRGRLSQALRNQPHVDCMLESWVRPLLRRSISGCAL